MNTEKNIKFSVLRLSLCCVLWGTSCLLFVYVRHFLKHFYSIIFTEALWKCFYMKNWNLYFIFHHEKYCWMDFYKYAFCFLQTALWRCCLFFLDCFTLPPSLLDTLFNFILLYSSLLAANVVDDDRRLRHRWLLDLWTILSKSKQTRLLKFLIFLL